ncbi:LacI family DNA-binding transcriptional regulator [Oryzibacter oryziterrae]|uniref:LacI family DNA-binding transcriptional regulator n=1 Tax=Oryzibacter oryziterrae TaxID=2766474 RepID=UPI001F311D20|nr:LacI family DNA-binding transcriptional regulator [Oryzibacter oryziterrae]
MAQSRGPTLAEVARIAGVSLMTASRAVNNRPGVSDEKREEILGIADAIGYVANRAAQKLSGGRTHVIGVIAQLHTPFTSDLVLGIGSAARAVGHEMLVYSLPDEGRRPPDSVVDLLHQVADGVIVILPYASDYLTNLSRSHIPIVTIEAGETAEFPTVAADNYHGAAQAIRHLHDLGHRRIGFITGNERLASARDRHRAFVDLRHQLGLDADDDLVAMGDFTQRGGFVAAERLMALASRPTAIFAANDAQALGAMTAIRQAGLSVPQDISLIGFDDILLAAQMHPPLTTIRQPLAQMARAAIKLLLTLVAKGEPPATPITLPTQLIVRETTAPPRA